MAPPLTSLKYHLECINPFQEKILSKNAPLGLTFKVHKRDVVGRGIYKNGVYEPALTKWIIDRFSESKTPLNFIDIGANIGYFTCILSKLASATGYVLAFEPEQNNVSLLRENLRINGLGNVCVEAVALGSQDVMAVLNIYKDSNQGRHSLVDKSNGPGVEVAVRRLDDIVLRLGRQDVPIDLIKMDIEGYEPLALQGAVETLKKTRALALEYSPELIEKIEIDPVSFLRSTAASFGKMSYISESGVKPTTLDECIGLNRQVDIILER
jgi:FkbM family methyltransferase